MDIWLISPKSVTLLLQGIENKRERVGGRVPQKLSPYGAVSRHGSGPPSWTAAQRGGPRSPRFPQKVSPCDFKPLKTKGMVVGRVLQKMSPCRAVPRHGSGHPLQNRSATRRPAVARISPKTVTFRSQDLENKGRYDFSRLPKSYHLSTIGSWGKSRMGRCAGRIGKATRCAGVSPKTITFRPSGRFLSHELPAVRFCPSCAGPSSIGGCTPTDSAM
jgi:hypothetical protein